MKIFKNILFISILTLLTFVGCSQKNETINQMENNNEVSKVVNNDFINELALHDAIRAKDKGLVDELIEKGTEVNTQDKYAYTPMHLAARLDQLEIAEKLLENKASVNNIDVFKDTPLLDSTRNSTNAMSRFLICNGADRNVKDRHDMTPLHNASKNNDLFISAMLQTSDITLMCQKLSITLEYYDEVENKICGNIPTGLAYNIDVTLSGESENTKAMGPYKSEIDGKTYCAKLDKPIQKNSNYLVTAIGTNTIDTAVATANLNDLRIKEKPKQTEYIEGLYEALMTEFGPDFEPWNAELDKNGLVFRFKNPKILFNHGSSTLKTNYKVILDNFFPRYLKVLDEYREEIEAVRVEGHTSSVYSSAKNDEERYNLNKKLSKKRADKVYAYTLNINNEKVKADKTWLDKIYSPHGMSYDNLIYDENGVENEDLSRRVEFRINKVIN